MIRQIYNQECATVTNKTTYRCKCISVQENNFFKSSFYAIKEIFGSWEISCIPFIFCGVKLSLHICMAIYKLSQISLYLTPNTWTRLPQLYKQCHKGVHSNHATFWMFSYKVFKFKDMRYHWQKLRGSKCAGNTVELSNLISRQVIIKDLEVLPQPCQSALPMRKGKKECWCVVQPCTPSSVGHWSFK